MRKSLYTKPRLVSKIRRTKVEAYTKDWRTISEQIMKRDGNRCRECGVHRSLSRLEVHHVVPVSKGGRTVGFNLVTLCATCHSRKPNHAHLATRIM